VPGEGGQPLQQPRSPFHLVRCCGSRVASCSDWRRWVARRAPIQGPGNLGNESFRPDSRENFKRESNDGKVPSQLEGVIIDSHVASSPLLLLLLPPPLLPPPSSSRIVSGQRTAKDRKPKRQKQQQQLLSMLGMDVTAPAMRCLVTFLSNRPTNPSIEGSLDRPKRTDRQRDRQAGPQRRRKFNGANQQLFPGTDGSHKCRA
jgi:hypothetical protein